MRKILTGLLIIAMAGRLPAQLVINNAVNAADGVQNILLGEGISVSNITFSGNPDQVGGFTCNNCNLGLSSGLVMGSGNVNGAAGPNNSGSYTLGPASGWGASDPDLAQLSLFGLNDAAVLRFDFVPTGDSVEFRFVFGSDEYPEYSNSSFNDAFGFFLSGPGITGPFSNGAANIALIPGTTVPVTINNLNNGSSGTGPCEYCQYYIHNGTGSQWPFSSSNYYIQSDGFTTVLTARAVVQCGQTYRIKLAIADAGDASYDSYVFLEAGSFQSNQLAVSYTGATFSPGLNSVYEGCDTGYLVFTRPASQATMQEVYQVSVSGQAQNGVDFNTIGTSLVFPVSVTSVSIPVTAVDDDILEGTESFTVTVTNTSACANGGGTSYTVDIVDLPPLNVTLPDVTINCGESATLVPQLAGGVGFYHVSWPGNGIGTSLTVSPDVATEYTYVVTDTCGVDAFQGVVEVGFPDYPPIQVGLGGDQALTCLDPLNLTVSAQGGYGAYTYSWSPMPGISQGLVSQSIPDPVPGIYAVTVTDQCGSQETGSMTMTIPPVPVVVDGGPDLSVTCLDQTTLTAVATGGVGSFTYSWSQPGSGVLSSTSQVAFQTGQNTSLAVTATDECGNSGSDIVVIAVPQVAIQLDLGPDLSVTCQDITEVTPQVAGGVGSYSYSWVVDGVVTGQQSTLSFQVDEQTPISLQVQDQCGNQATDLLNVLVPPVPVNVDLGPDVSADCLDLTTLTATVSGGVGQYAYAWSVDNQTVSLTPSLQWQTDVDEPVNLVVTDECGNTGTDVIQILIPDVPVFVDLGDDIAVTCLDVTDIAASVSGGVGAYSYAWSAGGPLLGTGSTFSFQTDSEAVMQLSVTDECGNTGTDNVLVSILPVPVLVDLGPDVSVNCLDWTALNASVSGGVGDYSYTWSVGNQVESLTSNLQWQTDNDETVTLVVTDECGNTGTDIVQILVPDVPVVVDLGDDIQVTCLDMTDLAASVSGGVGAYSYGWSAGGPVLGTQSTYSVQADSDAVIQLAVTDQCGNTGTDEILVQVPPVPVLVDLGPDLTVTCLDNTTLNAAINGGVGQYTYQWSVNNQVQGEDATLTWQTGVNAQVSLLVTDACGNVGNDQFNLLVPPVPVTVDAGPDQTVQCLDEASVEAQVTGGVGTYSYNWTNGVQNLSVDPFCTFDALGDATLTVTAEDECGNVDSDQVFIDVQSPPIVLEVSSDTTICVGDQVILQAQASGGIGPLSYYWTPGGSAFPSLTVGPSDSQVFQVQVTDNCGEIETADVFVEVGDVYPGFTVDYFGSFGVQLNNHSQNAVFFEWEFSDGTISTEEHPVLSFSTLQPILATLHVTGEHGCMRTISEWLYPESSVYVPNCFTPDNDGVNDAFRAYGHDLAWFRMSIFNRWGEPVFRSEDIEVPWDGSHLDGAHYSPDGVYSYKIEAQGIRGNVIEKEGYVVLIR